MWLGEHNAPETKSIILNLWSMTTLQEKKKFFVHNIHFHWFLSFHYCSWDFKSNHFNAFKTWFKNPGWVEDFWFTKLFLDFQWSGDLMFLTLPELFPRLFKAWNYTNFSSSLSKCLIQLKILILNNIKFLNGPLWYPVNLLFLLMLL